MGVGDGERARLLVVDDDPATLQTLVDTLELDGYTVDTAAHGAEALVRAAAAPPALIILDVFMPVMDGPTFAREYRSRPGPHAPLLCLSVGSRGQIPKSLTWADAVLIKPYDLDELLETVAQLTASPPPAP